MSQPSLSVLDTQVAVAFERFHKLAWPQTPDDCGTIRHAANETVCGLLLDSREWLVDALEAGVRPCHWCELGPVTKWKIGRAR